jgi:hypothetical protein
VHELYCEKAGMTEHKDFIRWMGGKRFVQKCKNDASRRCGANCPCFDIIDTGSHVRIQILCSDITYTVNKENFDYKVTGALV